MRFLFASFAPTKSAHFLGRGSSRDPHCHKQVKRAATPWVPGWESHSSANLLGSHGGKSQSLGEPSNSLVSSRLQAVQALAAGRLQRQRQALTEPRRSQPNFGSRATKQQNFNASHAAKATTRRRLRLYHAKPRLTLKNNKAT